MKRVLAGFCLAGGLIVAAVFHETWLARLVPALGGKTGDAIQSLEALVALIIVLFSSIRGIFSNKRSEPPAPPQQSLDSGNLLNRYYEELYRVCQRLDLSIIDHRFADSYRKTDITLPDIYQDMEVVYSSGPSDDKENKTAREPFNQAHQVREPLLKTGVRGEHARLLVGYSYNMM